MAKTTLFLRLVDPRDGSQTLRELVPSDGPQTIIPWLLRGFFVGVVTQAGTPPVRRSAVAVERRAWEWRSGSWVGYQGLSVLSKE
jgi:hypothetical protein